MKSVKNFSQSALKSYEVYIAIWSKFCVGVHFCDDAEGGRDLQPLSPIFAVVLALNDLTGVEHVVYFPAYSCSVQKLQDALTDRMSKSKP